MKLYDKSKEAAEKCLEKLQLEKEENNILEDKLIQALKTKVSQQHKIAFLIRFQQEAHQQVIEDYKITIEGFKSLKLNLKQEWKVGRIGGSRWPLWVTKVCCELLVNGLPPSAVPSSIGTLFATLYGKEPKKIPSLNYIQQC